MTSLSQPITWVRSAGFVESPHMVTYTHDHFLCLAAWNALGAAAEACEWPWPAKGKS